MNQPSNHGPFYQPNSCLCSATSSPLHRQLPNFRLPITLIIPLQILFSMPALIPFNSFVLRLNQTSLPSRKQSPTGLSHHTLHFPPIALPYFASSSLYIVIVLVSSFLFYHSYLLAQHVWTGPHYLSPTKILLITFKLIPIYEDVT